MCPGDAFDDRQAEADACMVGAVGARLTLDLLGEMAHAGQIGTPR